VSTSIESYLEPPDVLLSKFDRTQEIELFSDFLYFGEGKDLTAVKFDFLFETEDVFSVSNRIDIKFKVNLFGPTEAEKVVLFLSNININYTAVNSENFDDVLKSAKENENVLEAFETGRATADEINNKGLFPKLIDHDAILYYEEGYITYPIEHKVSILPVLVFPNDETLELEVIENILTIHPHYTKILAEANLSTIISTEIQDRSNKLIIGLTLVIISGIPFGIGAQFNLKRKQEFETKGATGDKGDKGATGDKGDKGATGDKGTTVSITK